MLTAKAASILAKKVTDTKQTNKPEEISCLNWNFATL